MKAFKNVIISRYFDTHVRDLSSEIFSEDRNTLVNVDEEQYLNYLCEKHGVESISVDWDHPSTTDDEKLVPADRIPINSPIYDGKLFRKHVITFHIPISGNAVLLSCEPSTTTGFSFDIEISNEELQFDLVNHHNSVEEIRHSAKSIIDGLRQQLDRVLHDVKEFNVFLRNHARGELRKRKDEVFKQLDLVKNLNVPIKLASPIPKTFIVPTIKLKSPIIKPLSSNKPYKPEPALEDGVYQEILRIVFETGREMERLPSTFYGKNEETLRDHLLLVLSTHVQSATAETFNRRGKTDILIRHDGSNVFVAECKIWKGERSHLKTIDQILRYLTWRDSKAAIFYFIQNRMLQPVFDKIYQTTPHHQCHVASNEFFGEGRYDYSFHLLSDCSRGVRLSIICFHFPSQGDGA